MPQLTMVSRTPRIRSWRSGREWALWHLFNGVAAIPICGASVPDTAHWCELHETSAALALPDICKSYLRVYSESEVA
jgi:hypothetical protein